jgi:hypothetical protein
VLVRGVLVYSGKMFGAGYVGARNIAAVVYSNVRNRQLPQPDAHRILCSAAVISACITGLDTRVDIAVWSFDPSEWSCVARHGSVRRCACYCSVSFAVWYELLATGTQITWRISRMQWSTSVWTRSTTK